MDVNFLVLSHLNRKGDFVSVASRFFDEPPLRIANALSLITTLIRSAFSAYDVNTPKGSEMYRIARHCAMMEFTGFFNDNLDILQNGRGVNTELFGISLANTVEKIAGETRVKSSTVNFLITSTAPVVLAVLYQRTNEKLP